MISLPPGYKPHPVTDLDREISLICWGFTIGFGILTSRGAWKQTQRVSSGFRIRSLYIWFLWIDIIGSFGFGIAAWFYMQQHVKHGFPLFFMILFFWAIQIQSQLQIIINRLSMIMPNKHRAMQLRWSVFAIILAINIMVGLIWVPTAMELDPIYAKINKISDRSQKVVYLLVDGSLNYYFVRLVNQQVSKLGLVKYKPLATFNTRIIVLSVAMDVMIIGMMSYPNPYVFMAFHPPAFLVKLNIEMSMADLILKIAKSEEFANSFTSIASSGELNYYASEGDSDNYNHGSIGDDTMKFVTARIQEAGLQAGSQTSLAVSGDQILGFENDEQPLHDTRTGVGRMEITRVN